MQFKNLREFIDILEQKDLLIRVDHYVDPVLEIAEITDRFSKQKYGGKALLFTNTGTKFPVVTNLLGSEARLALGLRHDNLAQIGYDLNKLFNLLVRPKKNFIQKLAVAFELKRLGAYLPVVKKGRGECQEVVITEPNLLDLPILKLWPQDGGRFITLPLVHTVDPISRQRNLGMYRVQIFGPDLAAMHWHRHKTGATHFRKYKQIGKKMPVAIAIGGDPAYIYSATAPMPEGFDEYILAGYLRKHPVELVKCITQDIEVPSDVDFVIEGYIDPDEEFILEGPFGDHTGFYSRPDYYPKLHVTAITHRKNAIYPATVVGIPPQEDAYFVKATERVFLPLIKKSVLNEILDWNIPVAGGGHNLALVQIKKHYPGQGKKVFNALWGAGQMMFSKVIVVLDQDIDIHNYEEVLRTVLENLDVKRDLIFTYGPLDVLDHSAEEFTYGSKLGIDATTKFPEESTDIDNNRDDIIFDSEKIRSTFDQIVEVNLQLLKKNIPVVIFSVDKSNGNISDFVDRLNEHSELMSGIKLVVIIDSNMPNDLYTVAWLTGNNVAPARDIRIYNNVLYVDATFKTVSEKDVKFDYPAIAIMDKATINKVDENWSNYGLKDFIQSPSLKFH